jgi:hypothetical protein
MGLCKRHRVYWSNEVTSRLNKVYMRKIVVVVVVVVAVVSSSSSNSS